MKCVTTYETESVSVKQLCDKMCFAAAFGCVCIICLTDSLSVKDYGSIAQSQ